MRHVVDNAIAKWIGAKFHHVQDVKFATTHREINITSRHQFQPDITVETWMNTRLYVYLVDTDIKSRTIKSILRQNTNASIGTVFIVNSAILPHDGQTLKIPDWQDDLRAMNLGAVYAYGVVDDELMMIQVNYTETNIRNEYTCWHTNNFPLDAVSVRRRDYNNYIKGTWYIGDISSAGYKRHINAERSRQRFHYRTKTTHDIHIETPDQINAAYLALEIEVGAGQDQVKEAFRKMARKYHPDVTEHDKTAAEKRFKEVKDAYDKIKSHRNWK